MKKSNMGRAMELLGEIRSQDFITDIAWECKEMRAWIKKADKLLKEEGYRDQTVQ